MLAANNAGIMAVVSWVSYRINSATKPSTQSGLLSNPGSPCCIARTIAATSPSSNCLAFCDSSAAETIRSQVAPRKSSPLEMAASDAVLLSNQMSPLYPVE